MHLTPDLINVIRPVDVHLNHRNLIINEFCPRKRRNRINSDKHPNLMRCYFDVLRTAILPIIPAEIITGMIDGHAKVTSVFVLPSREEHRPQCRNRTCQCKHCHLKGFTLLFTGMSENPGDYNNLSTQALRGKSSAIASRHSRSLLK